jgi:hypothetical protein
MLAFTMFVITLGDLVGAIILSLVVLGFVGYAGYCLLADWWTKHKKDRGE